MVVGVRGRGGDEAKCRWSGFGVCGKSCVVVMVTVANEKE